MGQSPIRVDSSNGKDDTGADNGFPQNIHVRRHGCRMIPASSRRPAYLRRFYVPSLVNFTLFLFQPLIYFFISLCRFYSIEILIPFIFSLVLYFPFLCRQTFTLTFKLPFFFRSVTQIFTVDPQISIPLEILQTHFNYQTFLYAVVFFQSPFYFRLNNIQNIHTQFNDFQQKIG